MNTSNNSKGEKRLRVRTRRLKEIDNTKLSLALWLVAKGIVEDKGEGQTQTDAADSPAEDGGEDA